MPLSPLGITNPYTYLKGGINYLRNYSTNEYLWDIASGGGLVFPNPVRTQKFIKTKIQRTKNFARGNSSIATMLWILADMTPAGKIAEGGARLDLDTLDELSYFEGYMRIQQGVGDTAFLLILYRTACPQYAEISQKRFDRIVRNLRKRGVKVEFAEAAEIIEKGGTDITDSGQMVIQFTANPGRAQVYEELRHYANMTKYLRKYGINKQSIKHLRKWEVIVQDEIETNQWLINNSKKLRLTKRDVALTKEALNLWKKRGK